MLENHKRKEDKEWIRKYEAFLKNKENHYFDEAAFIRIISYYAQHKKYHQALRASDVALYQFPFSVDLTVEKADILVKLNRPREAVELLAHTLDVQPIDPELLIQKGTVHYVLHEYEQAIGCYEEAIHHVDDKDGIYFHIGMAYQGMGKYAEAVEQYKKAIEMNILNEHALYELAYCLDVSGELESSLSYYQKFIDQDPYSEYAWYNLGIVQNKLGQYDEAIDSYEFATAIDESFSSAWFNMGNALMNLGKYDQALAAYLTTYDLEGASPETYCHIGTAYEKLEQYERAINYHQRATKLDPVYHEAWYGVGIGLALQDKWHEAIHFLNKALKLDPENGVYWKVVADAEYKTGNLVVATDAYAVASELEAENPEIWLDWSLIYYEQGDYDQALSILESGLNECPSHAALYYRSVVYMIGSGNYKSAINRLETALMLDYEGHQALFDFFPNPPAQKALYRIIDQFRKDDGKQK